MIWRSSSGAVNTHQMQAPRTWIYAWSSGGQQKVKHPGKSCQQQCSTLTAARCRTGIRCTESGRGPPSTVHSWPPAPQKVPASCYTAVFRSWPTCTPQTRTTSPSQPHWNVGSTHKQWKSSSSFWFARSWGQSKRQFGIKWTRRRRRREGSLMSIRSGWRSTSFWVGAGGWLPASSCLVNIFIQRNFALHTLFI